MKDIDLVKLEKYARIEEPEAGEFLRALIKLWNYRSYVGSKTKERLEFEIKLQIREFEEHWAK